VTSINLSGPFSILEDDSYREAVGALCKKYDLDWPRLDAITLGATWALARDPLSWEQITDDTYAVATWMVSIRGVGGDVDVATITRTEGFVPISQKHIHSWGGD
jgi:hypothetical protein